MAGPQVTKLLARMRQEHYELGIAIDVFDRLSNGHSKRQSADMMEEALAMASENGDKPKKEKKAKKTQKRAAKRIKGRKRRNLGVGMGVHAKPLPKVEHISGLNVSGMGLKDAISATLKAANEPIDARTLTALLKTHGSSVVDARGVSSAVTYLARQRSGVKRHKKSGLISIEA